MPRGKKNDNHEAEIALLNAKIDSLSSQISDFETHLLQFDLNEVVTQTQSIEIQIRTSQIEPLLRQFNDLTANLNCHGRGLSAQQTDDFNNKYYSTLTKAKTITSIFQNQKDTLRAQINQDRITQIQGTASASKLPAIEIARFDGEYHNWLSFRDSFTALVHDDKSISDFHKFQHLKSALQGKALAIIANLQPTSTNYSVAWDLLTKRFENKQLLVHSHIKAIMDLPNVQRESHIALRHIHDTLVKNKRALENLQLPVNNWDAILIHIISEKFDTNTRRAFTEFIYADKSEDNLENSLPTYKLLNDFLLHQCNLLEQLESNKHQSTSRQEKIPQLKNKNDTPLRTHVSKTNNMCPSCKDDHQLYQCKAFQAITSKDRFELASKLKLCKNCLRSNHNTAECKSTNKCRHCNKSHHTLLHLDKSNQVIQETKSEPSGTKSNLTIENTTNHFSKCTTVQILLATAVVKVKDQHGQFHTARCLLDSGSQSNYITEKFANKLNLRKLDTNLSVSGINKALSHISHKTNMRIFSRTTSHFIDASCLIIPEITGNLPNVSFDKNHLQIPDDIILADPYYYQSNSIDILIGAAHFFDILSIGQIHLTNSKIVLQKTLLGWIISGKMTLPKQPNHRQQNSEVSFHSVELENDSLSQQIQKFWEIDEPSFQKPILSAEEKFCEQHFSQTHTRDISGRFSVSLPLKLDISELGDTQEQAIRRFHSLENKLNKDVQLKQEYVSFMREYKILGHMTKIEFPSKNEPNTYYIPHHPVIKSASLTTKVRVVFDASAKSTSGLSLNDIQCVGPTLQRDLFSIIVNFRQYPIALTGDIAKMYRQVLINPRHRNVQRIFWREDCGDNLECYQLNTVTYGTSSASYLATKCLVQLASENSTLYPKACKAIADAFYVDDLLTGGNSIDEVCQLQTEISHILSSGGFELRKYLSNAPEVLAHVQSETHSEFGVLNLGENENSKTLGVMWNSRTDSIQFSLGQLNLSQSSTKRAILSAISQVFDPLGLLGPVIISAKILIQELWKLKISWDESIPQNLHHLWDIFKKNLSTIDKINIPRCVCLSNPVVVELHCFSDASEKAYGTSIYIRSIDKYGNVSVQLVCAKARVAPLHKTTIPRLELCGALLSAQLADKVCKSLKMTFSQKFFWCDSTIVLCWIYADPSRWKLFVANRVATINSLTNACDWRHVNSKENPADLISRGVTLSELSQSELWWHGPPWLSQTQYNLPENTFTTAIPDDTSEMKKCCCTNIHNIEPYNAKSCTTSCVTHIQNKEPFNIFNNISTYLRLKRVLAYCLRFIHNSRPTVKSKLTGPLCVSELEKSSTCLIKACQRESFQSEVQCLSKNKPVNRESKILSLSPFLDTNGILRVGGRIRHADYPFDKKHPILLDSKHRFTHMLMVHEHKRLLHCGPQTLLYNVREVYWPISGRNLAKKIFRECVTCFKTNPTPLSPIMGNLPKERLTFTAPFHEVGVDYAGPFLLKDRKTRNPKLIKCYISLFICFATKAVHLELVSELSTEAFIACLRRFIARRGKPKTIHSDNGTNFKGASSQLKELYNLFQNSDNQSAIINHLSSDNISWQFIPPRSPHFGGLWEAGIKSAKFHLKRILDTSHLDFEQFSTVLTQIESILNSRPLSALSSDPNDLNPITPAHFLIMRPITNLPDQDLTEAKQSRLNKYQQMQQLIQHFWTRRSREYVTELQTKTKWQENHPNLLKEGSLVIIKEDKVPVQKWMLGRVLALIPGEDGVNRVATLKVANGLLRRPVRKLCILPSCD